MEHEDDDEGDEQPIDIEVKGAGMPITNIPGRTAGSTASMDSLSVFNNGRGVMSSMRLNVGRDKLEIFPANPNEERRLMGLNRVNQTNPVLHWRGEMMYSGTSILLQRTTVYKADVDFPALQRDIQPISPEGFLKVFGQR